MYHLLASPPIGFVDRDEKIKKELALSQPPDSPGSLEAANICESPQVWWNGRYGCQPSNIIAQADYTLPEI